MKEKTSSKYSIKRFMVLSGILAVGCEAPKVAPTELTTTGEETVEEDSLTTTQNASSSIRAIDDDSIPPLPNSNKGKEHSKKCYKKIKENHKTNKENNKDKTKHEYVYVCPLPDSDDEVEVKPVTKVSIYGDMGRFWNQYVKRSSNLTQYEQPLAACEGTEASSVNDCIHAAELHGVSVEGLNTCDGITATDERAAFSWKCDVINGVTTVRSVGLAPAKGLKDLVDFTAKTFLANAITVSKNGVPIAATESSVWFDNPVLALPASDGANPVLLNQAKAIYVVEQSIATNGIKFVADQVGLVAKAGAKIELAANAPVNCNIGEEVQRNPAHRANVCLIEKKFGWIEGEFDAGFDNPADNGVSLMKSNFNQVKSSIIRGHKNAGIFLGGYWGVLNTPRGNQVRDSLLEKNKDGYVGSYSAFNRVARSAFVGNGERGLVDFFSFGQSQFSEIYATNNGLDGVYIQSSSPILQNIFSSNNRRTGLFIYEYSNKLVATQVVTNSNKGIWNYAGIVVDDGWTKGQTIMNATVRNNGSYGFYIRYSSSLLRNAVLANNNGNYSEDSAKPTHFSDIVSVGGSLYNISKTEHVFTDALMVDEPAQCMVGVANTADAGGAAGFVHGTCANAGSSNAILTTGVRLDDSFVGAVATDDSVNPVDNAGKAGIADIVSAVAWAAFENPFRHWGKPSTGPIRDVAAMGVCESGECQIWDSSLRNTDAVLMATLAQAGAQSASVVSGENCPLPAHGDNAMVHPIHAFVFHKQAIEVLDDYIGNDNGLCESSEMCIYTPNRGAYQGSGKLMGCNFQDGIVSGVKLFAYSQK